MKKKKMEGDLEKGSPEWNKLQVAKSTIKLTDVGATLLGGMTKEEARKIIGKYKK
jgi:hypothetical protein